MSKPFRLGDYLKPEETAVPKLNTERIEYLPLDLIDPDPDNFYSLEGIADLAENIELVGLLDPIRVRPALSVGSADSSPSGGAKRRYVVVSGHRRRAACMMIRDGGSHMFDGGVACIVERGGTDDWNRLRLIFANSHTRVLSPAEISRQADEVLNLLTKLKASGVELPGRMREHVAEALNVSSSKLGRVQAIRRNLVPEFLKYYDAGTLNEAVAYRISQESRTVQLSLAIKLGPAVTNLTAARADDCIAALAPKPATETMSEPDGDTSSGAAGQLPPVKSAMPSEGKADAGDDGPPGCGPHGSASAPTGEQRSFDPDEYLRERAEEDAEYLDRMGAKLDYFLNHLPGLVHNRQEGIEMFKKRFRQTGTGGGRVDHTGVGNGLELSRGGNKLLRSWTEAYDVFCCAAVNRLGKMPATPSQSAEPTAPPEGEPSFRDGTPPRDGRYFVRIDMGDGGTHEAVGSWRGGSWSVFNGPLFETMKVTGWYPLPEKGERKDA